MIPSYINIHPFCNGFSVTCHFPIWQVWQPVFFNTSGRSRTPGSRAVRLGYLQSIKRDTQPLGSPRYSCHTDLSDRQFVRPLVFDILRKSRQFPYRAPSARLRFQTKKAFVGTNLFSSTDLREIRLVSTIFALCKRGVSLYYPPYERNTINKSTI